MLIIKCQVYWILRVKGINHGDSVESFVPTNENIAIWSWCTEWNIFLQADHLPDQLNSQANQESRTVRDHCDWKWKQSVFNHIHIQAAISSLEVDLVASCLTKQFLTFTAGDHIQKQRQQMSSCIIGNLLGFYRSSVVSDTSLPDQGEKTGSKVSANNIFVENPVMVSTSSGTFGGPPLQDCSATRSNINDIGTGISDATRSTLVWSPGLSQAILLIMRNFFMGFRPHVCDILHALSQQIEFA